MLFVQSMHSEESPQCKGCEYRWPYSLTENADLSTMLNCLASGNKSIESSIPIDPWQTSVLELLLVCCTLHGFWVMSTFVFSLATIASHWQLWCHVIWTFNLIIGICRKLATYKQPGNEASCVSLGWWMQSEIAQASTRPL